MFKQKCLSQQDLGLSQWSMCFSCCLPAVIHPWPTGITHYIALFQLLEIFFWRPRFVSQIPPLLQSPHHANYVPLKICFGSSWLREFIEHKLLSPSQYLSSLPFLCHIMISLIIWKLVIILIIFNIFTGGFKNPHNHIFLLVGILIGPVWFMNL